MAEYIERGALIKRLCNTCDGWCENTECDCVNCKSEHRCDMVQEICDCPAADVAPVVHGRWNCVGSVCIDGEYEDTFRCSKCSIPYFRKSRYCPNCGAKMDGGDGNG